MHRNSFFSHVFTYVNPSAMEGEPGTFETGQANWKIDDVTTSSKDCSIQYKVEGKSGKLVTLVLGSIEKVAVGTWTKVKGVIKKNGDPDTYAVDVRMKDQNDDSMLEFQDQKTAQRVAKAIDYAAGLCKPPLTAMKTEDDAPY